ncbi:MAG TPA: hypothetical protein VLD67_12540 [Vicinamibacterales bacterium]|nr:hypothetical protein [Vicinamibacterales bacterium]
MPPRFAYWTIILEGKPTAFRARTRDELLPTFTQLKTRHPDVVMKWFARGRLWDSPEDERELTRRGRAGSERRGPDWRPGGAHRDPRERFQIPRDEKRQRFAARLRRERAEGAERERQNGPGEGDRRGPGHDRRWPRGGWSRKRREGTPGLPPPGGRPDSKSGRAPGEDRRHDGGRRRPDGWRKPGGQPGGRNPRGGRGGRRGGGGGSSR